MSYQLELEKNGKLPQIEMPPLPEEVVVEQTQEQNYDVHPEIAKELVKPVAQEQEFEEEVVERPQQVESANAKNIRALREKAQRADKMEQELNELKRQFQEMELARLKAAQPQHQHVEEPEYDVAPDDLVEGKHLRSYDKKIRQLEEQLRIQQQQAAVATVDMRLKAKYPDIDQVLSPDNIETLRTIYPEIAESISSNNDLYAKAVSAYTVIKNMGIASNDTHLEEKRRAQVNAAKPRPLTSVSPQQGDSPLSKANAFANGLTDDLKNQLRREMEAARRAM